MRVSCTSGKLKVHVVTGTYVVLLGFDLPPSECAGFLGFSIHRTDHTEQECYYLTGAKAFSETDPGFQPGSSYSTRDHPIQSFQWADYSAKPGHRYTYRVTALRGSPADLVPFAQAAVEVVTESPESGGHDIYFNRGVAASQAYLQRFGEKAPEEVPNRKAFEWLSRGLNEALEDYIESCVPGRHALRIAAYECNYPAFLQVLRRALERGVDIRIVYDARSEYPRLLNRQEITAAGLAAICSERTRPAAYISHNKFIVKLDDALPVSVWTGGTNFSEGGIFGHSNAAHVVEDSAVAARFMDYWSLLAADPASPALKTGVEALSPQPLEPLPIGTSVIFSPRKNLAALDWYARLARQAQDGLFMTFAFGMNATFQDVYQNGIAPIRMALLDKLTRPMEDGPEREAEEGRLQQLRNLPENVFAVGNFIRTNAFDGWVQERLSGLNSNVRYIHNKFMLVNPLTDDPVVVAGSANFSDASTLRNDENMLVVRGDTRVADIYLGEFMRLYSHHAFRESLQWRRPDDPPKPLRTDDWWADYFGSTQRSTRRRYFARASS